MASSHDPYYDASRDPSAESSANASGAASPKTFKGKHQVKFSPGGESLDTDDVRAPFDIRDGVPLPGKQMPELGSGGTNVPLKRERTSGSSSPHAIQDPKSKPITSRSRRAFKRSIAMSRIKTPPASPTSASLAMNNVMNEPCEEGDIGAARESSEHTMQDQARHMGNNSRPGSRRPSAERSRPGSPTAFEREGLIIDLDNIYNSHLASMQRRMRSGNDDDTDEDDEYDQASESGSTWWGRARLVTERILGYHSSKTPKGLLRLQASTSSLPSSQNTTPGEKHVDDHVSGSESYRPGLLSTLLNQYNEQGLASALAAIPGAVHHSNPNIQGSARERPIEASVHRASVEPTPASSTGNSPKRERQQRHGRNTPGSTGSLASLLNSTTVLAQPASPIFAPDPTCVVQPRASRRISTKPFGTFLERTFGTRGEAAGDTTPTGVTINETLTRQVCLLKLAEALMRYGAPTHRLEDYMGAAAEKLRIEGQFLYIPGCMIISFDDSRTHTADVNLVRVTPGVNLGKLSNIREIYKRVADDEISAKEALSQLNALIKRKPQYGPWQLVFVYGVASASVGPFAFQARPIDLPISFVLGSFLGVMQLIFAPKSDLYLNVFEISAALITSFCARAFGSIHKGELFCFSAMAQSSIALILPGYTFLCGSLELQSRNIVAGSVRMVYAVIYSLFLGFGITIGSAAYGGVDKYATTSITCQGTMPGWYAFLSVAPFTVCLIMINQGESKHMPLTILISYVGYAITHFSAIHLTSNAQIANTLGALAVGIMGNLYSRFFHGLAMAPLLPAILVLVPSGLAAGGSLVSGVASAMQITGQKINGTVAMGTTTVSNATQAGAIGGELNTMVFNVGFTMIEVAIGIALGLFLSVLIVYPRGKKKSVIFSF